MRKYLCTLYDGGGDVQSSLRPQLAEGPSQAAVAAAEEHGDEWTAYVVVTEEGKATPYEFSVIVHHRCESVRYVRGTGPSPE